MAPRNTRSKKKPKRKQRKQKPSTPLEATPPINSQWPALEDSSSETPAQRKERMAQEREAKRINDEIDAQLAIDRAEFRKRRVKVVFLGQASGKLTTLRNFWLNYAPTTFHAEADVGRADFGWLVAGSSSDVDGRRVEQRQRRH